MNSIFSRQNYKEIEIFKKELLAKLNSKDVFNNPVIETSPRMVGDAVQELIEEYFANGIPKTIGTAVQGKFARRAMADVAFEDKYKNYIMVDVKTHNEDTAFNMPNLTSVERLARFYQDDDNFFALMIVKYKIARANPRFSDIIFVPIEHLKWDCLTIGALGWGQIQIANAKIINISPKQTRKEWMLSLCDALDIFYPKELTKIGKRINYFKDIRAFWEKK